MSEDLPIGVIKAVKTITSYLTGNQLLAAHIFNTGAVSFEPGRKLYTPIAQDMIMLDSGRAGRLEPESGNKQLAIDMLIKEMPLEFSDWYVMRREAHGEDWWLPDGWHFGGGMAIRNLLRKHGFSEEYFGVGNLDDIYIGLVEEAMQQCGNS
jgi:hypothetical protein